MFLHFVQEFQVRFQCLASKPERDWNKIIHFFEEQMDFSVREKKGVLPVNIQEMLQEGDSKVDKQVEEENKQQKDRKTTMGGVPQKTGSLKVS